MKKMSLAIMVALVSLALAMTFAHVSAWAQSAAKHATLHVKIVTNASTIGAYSPKRIVVHTGDRIVFRNTSDAPHTVTSDRTKVFDSGNINTGASWTFTAKQTGSFAYHCTYHPGMHGTIVVKR